MILRAVPFGVLLGLLLEVDIKSTSQEKSAVLISNMSIIKSTVPSSLRKMLLKRILKLSRNQLYMHTLSFVYLVCHGQFVPQKVSVFKDRVL